MNEVPIPDGYALANGHVYMIHFDVEAGRANDEKLARALEALGVVRVQHAATGGVEVVIKKTIQNEEENA